MKPAMITLLLKHKFDKKIQVIFNLFNLVLIFYSFLFFYLIFIFFLHFSSYLYLCIFSCVCVTYNCTVHVVNLTYISLLVIFCIMLYVTNTNLES